MKYLRIFQNILIHFLALLDFQVEKQIIEQRLIATIQQICI